MSLTPPEFIHFENLQQFAGDSELMAIHDLTEVSFHDQCYPIRALRFGSTAEHVPVLFFIGGIHGIERIGSQVVLAFLDNFIQRLQWDETITHILSRLRIWFIPIANPIGIQYNLRSNGNHVDLMRNAPVEAPGDVTFLVGGQRFSKHMFWFRGNPEAMEVESQALTDLVINESTRAPFSMLLDVHSGFGAHDRLWFPMASRLAPIEHLPEIYSLYQLFKRNYPNHDYVFEPQSTHYLTNGDLWDYAYLQVLQQSSSSLLLPFTLEMGSWRWLKKNPLQIGRFGLFNPVKPHRVQRALRRHLSLMEFLIRATSSWHNWVPEKEQMMHQRSEALKKWYSNYG